MKERTRRGAVTLSMSVVCLLMVAIVSYGQAGKPKAASKVAAPSSAPNSQVVATVDGEKITRQDIVDDLFADQMAQLAVTNPQFVNATRARPVAASLGALVMQKMAKSNGKPVTLNRDEAIDWLFKDKQPILLNTVEIKIRELVVRHEAKKRDVAFTPEELAAKTAESMNMARTSLHMPATMTDKQLLATVGYRQESLRRGIVVSLLLEKIMEKELEEKLKHKVGPADFLDASHILVRVQNPNAAEKEKSFAEALKKIQGYADEIKSGKITFEAAAQQYSDDPSKFQKGSLGIFLRGTMVPEFDKAAFELEPGKVSEPVRSVFGWHLIKVNRQGKDLTGPERAGVVKRYQQGNIQAELSTLVSKAKVVNLIASKTPQASGMPMTQ